MFVIYNKCTFEHYNKYTQSGYDKRTINTHQIIHRSLLDIRINERLNTQFIAEVC